MDEDETVFIARLRALLEVLPPALDRQVGQFGLTSYEYALLDTVRSTPERRLRLSRLASSTNATLPRLSRVISALERKGLVVRRASEDDSRATDAVLTERGEEALARARPCMDGALQRLVIDPLTTTQLQEASAAIHAILTALDPDGRLAVLDAARRTAR